MAIKVTTIAPTAPATGSTATQAERDAHRRKYPWLYPEGPLPKATTEERTQVIADNQAKYNQRYSYRSPAPVKESLAAPAPPDALKAASAAQLAAMQAAAKRRRKAKFGFTLGLPRKPATSSLAAPAQPRSLSGY